MAKRSERRRRPGRWLWGGLAVIALLVIGLGLGLLPVGQRPAPGGAPPAAPVPPPPPIERLAVKVLAVHPHDPACYTQGLLWYRGELYESCGLYGKSSLRRVDPATGAIRQSIEVPAADFAEGLALVGERLIQLTWREGTALIYDRASFARAGVYSYQGEGWGLCADGRRLVMSDGSDRLTLRDPGTFAPLPGGSELKVTRDGVPVEQVNELECVGQAIYANVWQTDEILRLDAATGRVTGSIDAAGLLTAEERERTDVLNGIAWNPETRRFWITGKLWPKIFEVEFVPAK
jgi:glutaminyl-peptide cyclotransferase